jgi:pimeloyl-ACP methyl ester carboxylesterase
MGAEFRHETVDCAGIKLHCAVAGDAGKPLMLFLDGFPEFWAAWRGPMQHFAARGWLCVAPDLRGYNLSDKPEGVEHYKAKHLVADVLALGAHYSGNGGKDRFVWWRTTGAAPSPGASRSASRRSSSGW